MTNTRMRLQNIELAMLDGGTRRYLPKLPLIRYIHDYVLAFGQRIPKMTCNNCKDDL